MAGFCQAILWDRLMSNIEIEAVETIILRTKSMPEHLVQFHRALPGRAPSEHSKVISHILAKLSDEEAVLLIRDVVDSTVFSLLHLFDLGFKDRHIRVSFDRIHNPELAPFGTLLDTYRERVDPGGMILD